jgi:hypothetical protein
MIKNLLEPSFAASEFPGANFFLSIDVGLLQLNPIVAESAVKQTGPSDVVLGVYEDLKTGFAVGGRHIET